MSETLIIENAGVQEVQRTELEAAASKGATSITVVSNAGITTDHFALIGNFGDDTAEILNISSSAADALGLGSALSSDHSIYSPVRILQADKFRIYRAANVDGTVPADGAFALLQTVSITPDNVHTVYVDSSGGIAYWYKITQYNSDTLTETALADAEAQRGGGGGDYALLADIREDAGFEDNPRVSDGLIARYRRRAQSEVDARLSRYYVVPFTTVPNDIREIVILLAAGWLQLKNYGEMSEGTNKEGRAKLKEARAWLDLLCENAEAGVSLLPGAEVVTENAVQQVYGWPDDTTATADPDTAAGGDAMFKVSKDF